MEWLSELQDYIRLRDKGILKVHVKGDRVFFNMRRFDPREGTELEPIDVPVPTQRVEEFLSEQQAMFVSWEENINAFLQDVKDLGGRP